MKNKQALKQVARDTLSLAILEEEHLTPTPTKVRIWADAYPWEMSRVGLTIREVCREKAR